MSEQKPRLEERFSTASIKTMALALGWLILCTGIVLRMGTGTYSDTVLMVVKVVSIVGVGLAEMLLVSSLLAKIHLDENGVEEKNPLDGSSDFRWEELNTAAIVVFTVQKQSMQVILLSTRQPEEVLTSAALKRSASRHEQVRIPYTEKRREIVEYYLHMELPVIRL